MLRSRIAGARRRVAGFLDGRGSQGDAAPARAEVADLRRRLRKRRDQVQRLQAELRATRASLRNPFPETELPEHVQHTIAAVREEKLTYLSSDNLAVLASVVTEADHSGLPGLVVEAGTALGGSAIVLAAAKRPDRPMKVYDVFGMIPEPSAADGTDVHERYEKIRSGQARGVGGEDYYGYREDLLSEVTDSFARHGVPVGENNVELVKGLFQDTIDLDEPVAFAHLDGDWYESTMVCLERLAPLLVPGGRLVLDDYYHWSGARTAVEEYFEGRPGFRLERRAKLHVVRI
jgi:asparagine synthase (glutamine-hydrolysing)